MSDAKLLAPISTWFSHRVSTLTLFVTNACNARCGFCFNWQAIETPFAGNLLSLDEIEKLAANIGPLPSLIISGGEPFLRADLGDIVRAFVRRSRVRYVSIPTNAFTNGLVDQVERMINECPTVHFRLLVGVDGIGEEHDTLRGVPGGFVKMAANLRGLIELSRRHPNISVNAVTVFHNGNRLRMEEIADWVHTQGVFEHKVQFIRGDYTARSLATDDYGGYERAIRYSFTLFHQRGLAGVLHQDLFAAANRTSRLLTARRLGEKRPVLPCQAGRRILVIREQGDVYPCELLPRRLGNLREFDFDWKRLMSCAERRQTVKWIRQSGCWCSTECMALIDSFFSLRGVTGILREWLGAYLVAARVKLDLSRRT